MVTAALPVLTKHLSTLISNDANADEQQQFAALQAERSALDRDLAALNATQNRANAERDRDLVAVYCNVLPAEGVAQKRAEIQFDTERSFKLIYAVRPDMTVVVAEESTEARADRVAHSELVGGQNVYGAGQLRFEVQDGAAVLLEIDNGSGHYRPDSTRTLSFVKCCIEAAGVDVSKATLRDALSAGAHIPDSGRGRR